MPKINKQAIIHWLITYIAHEQQEDIEGMRFSMEALFDEIAPDMLNLPAVRSALSDESLKCPTCEDWTWNGLDLSRNGRFITVQGDCGHDWKIELDAKRNGGVRVI